MMDPLSRLEQLRGQLVSLSEEVDALCSEWSQTEDSAQPSSTGKPKEWAALLTYLALKPTMEEDDLLNTILRCAMHITTARGAGLTIFDSKRQKLVFRALVGEGAEELLGSEVPLEGSQHGFAFATGEIQTGAPLHRQADAIAGATFHQVLVAPMVVDGQSIGTISAVNKEEGVPFTPEDTETYGRFSELAALVVRQRMRESLLRAMIEGEDAEVTPELSALAFGQTEEQLMRLFTEITLLASKRERFLPLLEQLVSSMSTFTR